MQRRESFLRLLQRGSANKNAGQAARVFVQCVCEASGDDLRRLQKRHGGHRREQNNRHCEAYKLGHLISLTCSLAFVFEMPALTRMDARN